MAGPWLERAANGGNWDIIAVYVGITDVGYRR
ncbi:MAG: hypothetical protein RL490_1840 [Pseudomonadota bacterium]